MEQRQCKTKEEALQYAIKWQSWASEQNLSYGELLCWHNEFELIGKKWKLLKEFKENGII